MQNIEQTLSELFWYGLCLSPLWVSLLAVGLSGWQALRLLTNLSHEREIRYTQWFFALDMLEPIIGFALFFGLMTFVSDEPSQSPFLYLLIFPGLNILLASLPLGGLSFQDRNCRYSSLRRAGLMWARWLVNFAGWGVSIWFVNQSGEMIPVSFFVWILVGIVWLIGCSILTKQDYEKFSKALSENSMANTERIALLS